MQQQTQPPPLLGTERSHRCIISAPLCYEVHHLFLLTTINTNVARYLDGKFLKIQNLEDRSYGSIFASSIFCGPSFENSIFCKFKILQTNSMLKIPTIFGRPNLW